MIRWCAPAAVLILAACTGTAPPSNTSPATSNAVAGAIDITVTPGRAVRGDADMRTLEPHTSDLDGMIERGVIRILVAPGRTHFETDNGVERGRTVDAAAAFERFVNERIAPRSISVTLIAAEPASLIDDVISGRGDIAANVLQTFERDEKVAFAKPVRTGIRELIVTGPNEPRLVSLEDVGGRRIHVRRDSDHHASLIRLNAQLKSINRPPAQIVLTDGTDEELLDRVNAGTIPATLADDYIFDAVRPTRPNLSTNREVAVSQDGAIAWVTRKDAARLLELINEFFSRHRLTF